MPEPSQNARRKEHELVALACRILGRLDLTKETSGHVSARIAEDEILIRARGPAESGVRFTTADEIISIDLRGRAREAPRGLEPPLETALHTAIYRARADVRSVAHVHPPTAVLMTICDRPLEPLYGAYDPSSLRLAVEGIASFDRSVLVATDALGDELAKALGSKRACLMRGHGLTTVGASVEEATLTAIKVNELAAMNYQAALLGGARPISEADRATFESTGQIGGARAAALWRYYERLTAEGSAAPRDGATVR